MTGHGDAKARRMDFVTTSSNDTGDRLLKVLGFGASFWNIWRGEHPEVPIVLDGANLEGARLDGANLRQADFRGACLTNVTFSPADLEGALNLPSEAQ